MFKKIPDGLKKLFKDFKNLDFKAIIMHQDYNVDVFVILNDAPNFNDWCFDAYRAIPVKKNILGFELWMAMFEDTPYDLLNELSTHKFFKVRLAVARNPCTPLSAFRFLFNDLNAKVKKNAIHHIQYNYHLSKDPDILKKHILSLRKQLSFANEHEKFRLIKELKNISESVDSFVDNGF